MHSPAESLALLPEAQRKRELASLTDEKRAQLLYHWPFWARPEQLSPQGAWHTWLILAGRGWGKTRTGAEWVRANVCPGGSLTAKGASRIALVAETAADARDVMVEGTGGLLASHPKDTRPTYFPSKRLVEWPNGARALLFNATEPDQLRGPQHDLAWCDELAKWQYAQETWDQLQFGLRVGDPRQCITTTPRPIPIIRDMVAEANKPDAPVVVTRGRTLDNAPNLAESFLTEIRRRYEGTRLGRQELDAEILDDVPGALWTRRMFDERRVHEVPPLQRCVVAIDPPASNHEGSDECGIIVAGVGADGRGYVIEDHSRRASPEEWARRAISLFDLWECDMLVAEANMGGLMVESVIRAVRPYAPVRLVRATRGKHIRAEPIAALYEQGRVSHRGVFPELEDQLCLFTPLGFEGQDSPDRADALVWAFTELFAAMQHIPVMEEEGNEYVDAFDTGRDAVSGY